MKTYKTFLAEEQMLYEGTKASTLFEGVIVDCWNLRNDKDFEKKILKQPYTKAFLKLDATGWATSGKKGKEQAKVLKGFSKLCKKKIKGVKGIATGSGSNKLKVSGFWKDEAKKGKDTSKADILIGKGDNAGISVKGPSALLMSGEQKESRATVLAAFEEAGKPKLKGELVDIVNEFVTTTRTIGADMTAGTLKKTPNKELSAHNKKIKKELIKAEGEFKTRAEATFAKAFKNPKTGVLFAREAMTGWEKFGGKTYANYADGDSKGEAVWMLVWDYGLNKLRFDKCDDITSQVASKMKMSATLKSGSYSAGGVKGGYAIFQTIRLTINTALDDSDKLVAKNEEIIKDYENQLSEGIIDEGAFTDAIGKVWKVLKNKLSQLWDWVTEKFSEIADKIKEVLKEGVNTMMTSFGFDVAVNVNNEISW